MNYPFWDTGIGYGVLMALVAVVHVFVSHFAIGGGLYLVVSEHAARRSHDTERLAFLEGLSRFFVLVTVVFGALTGVAIWFIIGLLNPAATEVLIHNFVWGWAIEWTFFVIEILAAVLYFYGWKRMPARTHLALGWIYFMAAWASLFVINGIITFMLTPGKWLVTGSFGDGFFNPTMLPSLVFRTGICIMLAGLYALFVISGRPASPFKIRTVRSAAGWALLGLLIALPSFFWYRGAIPADTLAAAAAGMRIPLASIDLLFSVTAALVVILLLFGLALPREYRRPAGVAVMLLGLVWFGSYEWFRESIRKPFVISGYMYGNAIEAAPAGGHAAGLRAGLAYRTGDDGADIFRRSCRSCHTLDGYNGLKPLLQGADPALIATLVRNTDVLRGRMPPFTGTEEESEILAAWLSERIDRRPLQEITGLEGAALGRHVYNLRCGTCHVIGGYNDKSETLAAFADSDLKDFLQSAGDLSPKMPAWSGSDTEREALISYLATLRQGGGS